MQVEDVISVLQLDVIDSGSASEDPPLIFALADSNPGLRV